jgi:phosphatidylserine/phosphatidylglycerophosphate/cardiolipin synthase-like enzyme
VAGADPSRTLWDGPIEILRGAEAVNRAVASLFREARREVLLFMGLPMLANPAVEAAFADLQARGVSVRQILSREFLLADDAGSRKYVEAQSGRLADTGRVLNDLEGKLIIVDHRVGVVALNRETGAAHQTSILRHRDLVAHLVSSFELHWELAERMRD